MTRRLSSPVFVGRQSELARLRAAVDRAAEGRPSIVVVAGEAGVGKSGLIEELVATPGSTAREREVLLHLAQGRTNREIGDSLFISEKTASVHVTHILDKLGVGSRVEAALAAQRLGLLEAAG